MRSRLSGSSGGTGVPPERCLFCGRKLTKVQQISGGVCWDWRCKNKSLEPEWGEERSRAAGRLSVTEAEKYPIIVVPHQTRRVTEPPPERRERFREHLTSIVRKARIGEPYSDDNVESEADSGDPQPLSRWLGRVCTACQGECCWEGEDHAFLDGPAIRRFAHRHPDFSAADIVNAYLWKLPDESFGGACVFQGTSGCTLPRSDRASLCNVYECKGLRMARNLWTQGEPEKAFVLAEVEGCACETKFID